MKFKNKWLKEFLNEDQSDDNPLEFVDQNDWEGSGKYQTKEVIFKYEGKFYMICDSRTGSYYSDYCYDSEDWENDDEQECKEVEKIEVIMYEWRNVK